MPPPILALTQGDPAGIGPEILLKILTSSSVGSEWHPLLVAERAALEAARPAAAGGVWERLAFLESTPTREVIQALAPRIAVLDPVGERRQITCGKSAPADAGAAVAALDAALELARSGIADALVTGPVSKESIARQHLPGFTGQTGYLASACGLERYGRDYLMVFLAEDLQVALLSTHIPLSQALAEVTGESLHRALVCLDRRRGSTPTPVRPGCSAGKTPRPSRPRCRQRARRASTSMARRALTRSFGERARASSTGF
jgi:4-hydroxythreonine-4-phosphate dehydrogenase